MNITYCTCSRILETEFHHNIDGKVLYFLNMYFDQHKERLSKLLQIPSFGSYREAVETYHSNDLPMTILATPYTTNRSTKHIIGHSTTEMINLTF
jgi:hypothetical protein